MNNTFLLALASATISVVCFGQNESLSIAGKNFRLGMSRQEVLRIVPLSAKSDVHSMESDEKTLVLFRGEKDVVGTVAFANGRVSCLIQSGIGFRGSDRVSAVAQPLLDFLKEATAGRDQQVTLSSTYKSSATKANPGITMESADIATTPDKYSITWATGLDEPSLMFSVALGICSPKR
jgi:hypothetical protein